MPVIRGSFDFSWWTCEMSLRDFHRNTFYKHKSGVCVCVCVGVVICEFILLVHICAHVACCVVSLHSQAACLEIDNRNLWKSWMTKTRWGFSTSLSIEESSCSAITSSFFVLVFPTLYEKNKLRETEGLLERKPQPWQSHSYRRAHSQLHHYRKFTSQTFSALSQKGPVDELWILSTKNPLFFVWLWSESCQCEDVNFCLFIQLGKKYKNSFGVTVELALWYS